MNDDYVFTAVFSEVFKDQSKKTTKFDVALQRATSAAKQAVLAAQLSRYREPKGTIVRLDSKRQIVEGPLYEVHFRDHPQSEAGTRICVMASTMKEGLEKVARLYPSREVTWLIAVKESFSAQKPEPYRIII